MVKEKKPISSSLTFEKFRDINISLPSIKSHNTRNTYKRYNSVETNDEIFPYINNNNYTTDNAKVDNLRYMTF